MKINDQPEDDQKKWANERYLEQGDFIYFRAGRTDGRSGSYPLRALGDAIDYAHKRREATAMQDDNGDYNVWTEVENFLKFMKYKLPTED